MLSVLPGDFTLPVAEAILEAADVPVLGTIENLTAQSLLFVEPLGESTGYRMLETVRQHGRGLLLDKDEADGASRAMASWCAAFARQAQEGLQGEGHHRWSAEIDRNMDSLRSALGWASENEVTTGLSIAISLAPYWWNRGLVADEEGIRSTPAAVEGASWLERLLDSSEQAPSTLVALGRLALAGNILNRLGREEDAIQHLQMARATFAKVDNTRAVGMTHYFEALSRYGAGGEVLEEHLRLAVDMLADDPTYGSLSRAFMAWYLLDSDKEHEASELIDSLISDEGMRPLMRGHRLEFKAGFAIRLGKEADPEDLKQAWELFQQAEQSCIVHLLQSIAHWRAAIGHSTDAAKLLGISQRFQDELGITLAAYENRERYALQLMNDLDPATRRHAYEEGRVLAPVEGLEFAEKVLGEVS